MRLSRDLERALRKLEEAEALSDLLQAELDQSRGAVEEAMNTCSKGLSNPVCAETFPVTEHRRRHRLGRPAKIETDPELKAFIIARIDRMTFEQVASDVATHFPKDRRVGKSAIHDRWQKNRSEN